jgi:hypothetical protein
LKTFALANKRTALEVFPPLLQDIFMPICCLSLFLSHWGARVRSFIYPALYDLSGVLQKNCADLPR